MATLRLFGSRPGEDRHLCTGPLYHAAPLRFGGVVHALGGTLVILRRFDAEQALAGQETRSTEAGALAEAVQAGRLGGLTVERADGTPVGGSPLADALEAAGFRATPRGLRLRS